MTQPDKDINSRTSDRKAGPKKGRPTAVHRDKKDPHAALHAPIRPARYREKRHLTSAQLNNPLIRQAFNRLSRMGDELRGTYLRSLDTIHGGRRTRSEKFSMLAKTAEQMLLRLDLATGVLGWLEVEEGRFCLSTQCNIAEHSDVSASSFSRFMHGMEQAEYVYRRIEKVRLDEKDSQGLHLVRTRVLVRFTEKFFADLGLRYLWFRAKKAAIKKRERELREIGAMRNARQEKASLEEFKRQQSRSNWQKSEARKAAGAQGQPHDATPRQETPCGTSPPYEPDKPPSGTVNDKLARLMRSVQVKKDNPPSE
ncbi:hypothetical protein [Pseudomonas viridiflava]|uniref:hypothetical protein n=1 Tax=Pseudomonas viridiflava TaxID=33069 RepID=UPI001F087211|nr:hypothetical protein [Pseudomonas viridiflava]